MAFIRYKIDPAGLLFAVGCVVSVLAYWVGLQGPFLLDDLANLGTIPAWLAGQLGLGTLLFERGAGMFGRPISMASFAINAWIGGYSPASLKAGNLIVHLISGLTLFLFLRRLLAQDIRLQPKAPWLAAVVAVLWLLHPLHASTVLYVVQRMAQLSTLFMLLGLWCYLELRLRLQQAPSRITTGALLLGISVFTLLAFLSKENGILLPLLCAVLEIAYFRGADRPVSVRCFLWACLLAPLAITMLTFTLKPGFILDAYVARDFTLFERLLSQGRALCDYIWKLVVPNTPKMGIFTDDFRASRGILEPSTTLISWLFLAVTSVLAIRWRTILPSFFFGWFFFLAAHALEAGPIALELYFEHRNYLPSVGILLALVSLVLVVGQTLARQDMQVRRIGVLLLIGMAVLFATGTHGRARVWRSNLLIAESSLRAHPDSLRANAFMMGAALDHGDMALATKTIDNMVASPQPKMQSMGYAYRVFAGCVYRQQASPKDLEAFIATTPLPLTLAEAQPFGTIYLATSKHPCKVTDDRMLGNALARLADKARNQPASRREMILIRYQAASFLVRGRDWQAALPQATLAWQASAEPPVALPLVLANLGLGRIDEAERAWREANARSDTSNAKEQEILRWLRDEIESVRRRGDATMNQVTDS
ncbi:hypothetical protein ACTJI2_11175 [Pseudoxanthomonas sp. 22568]|uniref:hypothetical protein n=1 Tax=Pseudoxanthomonas sp. 22568 TaxID=3453945 RepID=UPI003F85B185